MPRLIRFMLSSFVNGAMPSGRQALLFGQAALLSGTVNMGVAAMNLTQKS